MCGSPKLIAACHVLHRLFLPRHPPCALSSLTIEFTPAQLSPRKLPSAATLERSMKFIVRLRSPVDLIPKDTLVTLTSLDLLNPPASPKLLSLVVIGNTC